MRFQFQLPLSVRITLAERNITKARATFALARRNREQAETEANLPEGQRPPFSGLTALAALCVESDARRALWDAEDRLAVLQGRWPSLAVAPRHAL
jgi:hypothetical protein